MTPDRVKQIVDKAEARAGQEPKRGRPTEYTESLASYICVELASGRSLRSICSTDDMPAESTVRLWVTDDRNGFSAQYTRARDAQMDAMAEDILSIADEENEEDTQRAKLRIDTRKWLMSKMAPKKYGDKVMNEHSGPDGGPIPVRRFEVEFVEQSKPSDQDT
ncbi:terminase small subunit protein [Pseudochrobactrum sp. Wa41.01b-1]|uniref:terminase small subunit-like protein n=1 Tax=Pseudochrobactrum sp. Wa41.01b-1 TaxID=2864102 RepID=UPI00210815D7|nr:terminase small subunit protein [Pseudochrobactrum sp. Wa41.01b-1]